MYVEPGRVGIGFRRLSIIDLESGHQPLFGEDRSVAATCNGEIYNFVELRRRLERGGHTFSTRSDSETLVHLYEDLGTDFLDRLQGMFAIAVWDGRAQQLVLARDRLGVKPLYWAPVGDGLVYASEPGAFLASGLIAPRPDPQALLHYLTLQYVPPPGTGFAGIRKLASGEFLRARDGRIETHRYWRLRHDGKQEVVADGDALDALDHLLADATGAADLRRSIRRVPLRRDRLEPHSQLHGGIPPTCRDVRD